MSKLDDNRIVKTFAELRSAGKQTLLPFVTAGYPDLHATEAILNELQNRGARICEIGVPFSDPIADGPTIQASYTAALENGVCSDEIFKTVQRFRDSGGSMALIAMVSYSIVYKHGVADYFQSAAEAGFDGLIIPDLSLEEAPNVEALASAAGLSNIMLIAPNTPPQRRLEIASHSRGFIYYISVAGITGERDRLPGEAIAAVEELRKHTDTPICVGFGISNPQTVADVCKAADGAIVGSAIVHRITDNKDRPPAQIAAAVGELVAQLMAPLV